MQGQQQVRRDRQGLHKGYDKDSLFSKSDTGGEVDFHACNSANSSSGCLSGQKLTGGQREETSIGEKRLPWTF